MYYDYYLLVMQVYDKNYGNATYLRLYQNLHNFQNPIQGVKLYFGQKQKYFLNQCISVHIFWGVLYYICEIDQISPPPTLISAISGFKALIKVNDD